MKRHATANWKGTGKEGKGTISTPVSNVLKDAKYAFKCEVHFDTAKGEVTTSHLTVSAKVPGISKEKFDEQVDHAKKNCPVSKLLRAEISCDAKLE
jgi:osmotically inducible protein OsmC